jgi:hypothetical protein
LGGHDARVSWDLDVEEARELVVEHLAAMVPPANDEWIVTSIHEHEWGWTFSWNNRRRVEGSTAASDTYAGGGPILVDRTDGRMAMAGSAYPVDDYIDLWRSGSWPDLKRPK